jgi:hypothetical protein
MIEILHVSDLHLGKNAYTNGLAKSLLKAASERYPFAGKENTYLLVTGDVTDHGRNGEYDLAGQALTPFKDRIFVTPGNHDYGSWGGTDYNEEKAKHFDAPFAIALGFKHPFFGKKVFVRELQDQAGHTLLMIGLNSCAKVGMEDWAQGEIGEDQRNELAGILEQYDANIPKILFLHHIPNKDAAFPLIMTLKDWKELMAVVGDKVDVLAFGHQGKLEVGARGKSRTTREIIRPMELRSLDGGGKRALKKTMKRTWVLDADASVAEQSCYSIKWDGEELKPEIIRLGDQNVRAISSSRSYKSKKKPIKKQ